jgi:hypothetical protein
MATIRQIRPVTELSAAINNQQTRLNEDSGMACTARRLLTVVLLGGLLASPAARAQSPAAPLDAAAPAAAAVPTVPPDVAKLVDDLPNPLPESDAPASAGGWEPEFLQSLPRPPSQPRTLLQPAPPPRPSPQDLERPYFQWDPILDPPQFGDPGWFGNVQFDVIHPHIDRRLVQGATSDTVTTRFSKQQVNVAIGAARQDWTVAPRFEVGYRLPSGFGQFSVADRFFNSRGTDVLRGPNGPGPRATQLSTDYVDFDYGSREYTPWANWLMQWRFGLRAAYTDTDGQFREPFLKAAAGDHVLAATQDSSTMGFGPHFGFVLDRRLGPAGFSLVTKLDYASTFNRMNQTWTATTTTRTPSGHFDSGVLTTKGIHQNIPILNWQVGLGWQPPRYPGIRVFVGYVYEAWWNTETNSNANGGTGAARGDFTDQGIVFQASLNY